MHALTRVILTKGILGAFEDTGKSSVFSISPGVARTSSYTGLGRVVGEGARIGGHVASELRVRTDRHTGLAKHVSIGKQILRTVLHASTSVIICELGLNSGFLSAGNLAFTSHVAGPGTQWTSVSAVVADGRSNGTGRDTSVGAIVSE